MAIRLALKTEPYEIALDHGAVLTVKPLTTAVYEAAKAHAIAETRRLIAAASEGEEISDLRDQKAQFGYTQQLFAEGLAIYGITGWRGVIGDDDGPAPLTEDNVLHLMRIHKHAEEFVEQYTSDQDRLVAEGNGSGPSPSGTSAKGPDTARSAATRTCPARKVH